MDTNTLLETFNPSNAEQLTVEQLQHLQSLSNEELGILAKAYPNTATDNNYLLLHDSKQPDNRQLFPRSTWENLYKLRTNNKMSNLTAYSFAAVHNKNTRPANSVTRDITQKEKLPGIKAGAPQNPMSPAQGAAGNSEEIKKGEDENFEDLSDEAAKQAEKNAGNFPPLAKPESGEAKATAKSKQTK